MTQPATGAPPLPYRARPPQVLLAVGAVLVVSTAATVVAVHGGQAARFPLLTFALIAGGLSVRAAEARLRSTAESLAACAVGLSVNATEITRAGAGVGGGLLDGNPVEPAALGAVFLLFRLRAPSTVTWPLAAWGAAQLAVLRSLDPLPPTWRTEVFLAVSLVGLCIALLGRKLLARWGLVTTAPWWVAGVVTGTAEAWQADGAERWTSAVLVVCAATGVLLTRWRETLDPLLGPPRFVPVLSGVTAGAALTGAFETLGTGGLLLIGYLGVWLATLAGRAAEIPWREVWVPLAVALGTTTAVLAVARLAADRNWGALSLFLLATTVPSLAMAAWKPGDRPVTVPTAVLCGAGAALLALPEGYLTPSTAALWLTGLYAVAMSFGAELEPAVRRPVAAAAAVTATAALLLLAAQPDVWLPVTGNRFLLVQDHRFPLAAHLAVQGLFTLVWADRTEEQRRLRDVAELSPDDVALRRPAEPPAGAWKVGAAQLVLACWMAAAVADLPWVEVYTVPAAVGLVLVAGLRVREAPSWSAWGPGLLMAFLPTTAIAVIAPHGVRMVAVLVASTVVMVIGARLGVRAPILVGAVCAMAVPLGLAVRALPGPIAAALLVGAVLLGLGALRERDPVPYFRTRLADLR